MGEAGVGPQVGLPIFEGTVMPKASSPDAATFWVSQIEHSPGDHCLEVTVPGGADSPFWKTDGYKYGPPDRPEWKKGRCDRTKWTSVDAVQKDYDGWTKEKNTPYDTVTFTKYGYGSEKKVESEAPPALNEAAPAWITGDVEAPKGEKKMPGGWTMRAYTAEQQARLGVDEEGKPVTKKAATTPQTKPTHTPKKAATDSSSGQPEPKATLSSRMRSLVGHMETKARRVPPGWWIVAGVVGLLLFAGVNARARQQRRQELENIYRVALDDATPH